MKKTIKIIIAVLLVVMVFLLGIIIWKVAQGFAVMINKDDDKYNDDPVYVDHLSEFDIVNSNYIDSLYERYVAYKKKHSDYSDDKIITYVNIGLDQPFYSNMKDTDMSKGILVLCNKYNTLKKDYVPDLVSLDGYGGGEMQREAAGYFKKMVDAAKKDGFTIKNVSGYRSYATQNSLYNNYVSNDGREKADTYSARPGSSEHQTGLATDINWVSNNFENSDEFNWLTKHAHEYGFILRYPKNKTYITGYMYEPWHYRYVGLDVAKYIHEHDITYEEYYVTFIMKG